ncbi:MAG: proton-conducting transporter membrane subunit [Bacteroidales bacterium]
MELLPVLYIILPLLGAFLIPIAGYFAKASPKIITVIITLFLTIYNIWFFATGFDSVLTTRIGGWQAFNNIPIAIYLVHDGLSAFILLTVNLLSFFSAFYAMGYINRYTGETHFYALFCLMVAGMNGVVLSGDIFNIYVFLEIAVIASYALVAFGTEKQQLEASFKYQVLGGIASLLILFAIGLLYWQTQTLNLADISAVLAEDSSRPNVLIFTEVLLITGFGLKAAMIPFHAWLPDAHSSAPAPISAMLSGVLIKAVGIYVLFRLFFNIFALSYETSMVILTLGILSMVIGVLLAIGQWDLKRLLAYHSISQMGYVVMGLGIGMLILVNDGDKTIAALSMAGGLFHLINHALFKGLLFLDSGAIEYRTGTRNLRKMGGTAGKMPVTSATSLGASLAISGIPPFNGFFSKLLIIIAAVRAEFYLLAALAVFVNFVTLGSFMKFMRYAFYNKSGNNLNFITSSLPFSMKFSMIAMVILCVLTSLLVFPCFREILLNPAVDALINTSEYTTTIIGT